MAMSGTENNAQTSMNVKPTMVAVSLVHNAKILLEADDVDNAQEAMLVMASTVLMLMNVWQTMEVAGRILLVLILLDREYAVLVLKATLELETFLVLILMNAKSRTEAVTCSPNAPIFPAQEHVELVLEVILAMVMKDVRTLMNVASIMAPAIA
jgi:hypothetical protein